MGHPGHGGQPPHDPHHGHPQPHGPGQPPDQIDQGWWGQGPPYQGPPNQPPPYPGPSNQPPPYQAPSAHDQWSQSYQVHGQPRWGTDPHPARWGDAGHGSGSGGGSGKALTVVLVSVLVATALLASVGVLIARQLDSGDGERSLKAASGSSVSASSEPATTSTRDAPTTTEPSTTGCPPAVSGPNTPSGWQTVAGKRQLAYDVPADWEVAGCETLVGWEAPCPDGPFGFCPVRTMSGAAMLTTETCPDDSAGVAGLPGAKNIDDIDAAIRAESETVAAIYTSESGVVPQVSLSEPRRLTVGGRPAVHVVATATGIESSPCVGDTALHSMVATTVPGQPGVVLFVISLPQGMPGAADPDIIDQMVASLRDAN